MNLVEVNTNALDLALESVLGTAGAEALNQLYKIVDRAMVQGYESGLIDAYAEAAQTVEEVFLPEVERQKSVAFERGLELGREEGQLESYNNGYEAGVFDELMNGANDTVEQQIAEDRAWDAGYDAGEADGLNDARLEAERRYDEGFEAGYGVACENILSGTEHPRF